MNDLQLGDQIEIVFADTPGHSARGTVTRFFVGSAGGLELGSEDYIFCWLEISPEASRHFGKNADHSAWRRLEILYGRTRSGDPQVFRAGLLTGSKARRA